MISVCMPFWDRQAALDDMFRNYAEIYGPTFEFSICDDGAWPPAVASADADVVLTKLPHKTKALNPCVPINRAVAAAHGDIIVLTNPEIRHKEATIADMFDRLQHEDDYVAAPCWDEKRGWLAGPKVNYESGGRLPVPPGASFHFLVMFTRKLWEKAGGFDEDYRTGLGCDDNDWLFRAANAGARFQTVASTVEHVHYGSGIKWKIPHNRGLFNEKWPEARRRDVIARMPW